MTFSLLSVAFTVAPRLPLGLVMRAAHVGAGIAARLWGSIHRTSACQYGSTSLVASQRKSWSLPLFARIFATTPRNSCSVRDVGAPLAEGITFEGFGELVAASVDGPVVLALGHSGQLGSRGEHGVCANGATNRHGG